MKKGTCTRCGHDEVIRAKAANYAHRNTEKPMAVTADPRFFGSTRNPNKPLGLLYTYTCRSCGFTEWYAENPREIPIGVEFKTEIVGSPPQV